MKHLFIVNPIAGGKNHTDEICAIVKQAFSSRSDTYEIYVTKSPMDAAAKISAEGASGEELRVYACGGDGTFNECVCGAALMDNVAVCPFPTGTGNDFCRMFGEEKDLFRDLNAVLDGDVRKIDLIECNGRYSANICSVGIDARIGIDVHKYSDLPIVGGATAYVISALINVFKGVTTNMKITINDITYSEPITLACVCNGRFYGGGFNPCPTSMPDDGELDILVVKKVGILTFLALIGKYASGRADEMPHLIYHHKGDGITVEFEEENVVNVDGEAMYTKKAVMKLIPKALNLITPRNSTFLD